MRQLRKSILTLGCLIGFIYWAPAQIMQADIQINGLTCSLCTRSVEKAIQKLPFVYEIEVDLEKTWATVTFYPYREINIQALAQAVKKAGFSVGHLYIHYDFDYLDVETGTCHEASTYYLQFVKTKPEKLLGRKELQVLGKAYLNAESYQDWKPYLQNTCANDSQKPIFYVTIPQNVH